MDTTELDNTKMKVMKEVADANVLLANTKAEIAKLIGDKDNFFKLREDEVIGRIKKVLEASTELVNKTKSNYALVHEFVDTLKTFADFIKDGQTQLGEAIKSFISESDKIILDLKAREEVIKQHERQLISDKTFLASEQGRINTEKGLLRDGFRKLHDGEEALKRSIERLKKGKI